MPNADLGDLSPVIRATADAIVAVCDADGDRELSGHEFRRMLAAWGLAAEHADAACLSEAEQACLTFTAEVLHRNHASDATFERLRRSLSPREIVELLIVVGVYTLVSRLTTALGIDTDRDAGAGVVGFARGEPAPA